MVDQQTLRQEPTQWEARFHAGHQLLGRSGEGVEVGQKDSKVIVLRKVCQLLCILFCLVWLLYI